MLAHKKKKIFILIFSIFLILTTIFVPFIFFIFKKDNKNPKDYDYGERHKQPDYIEFEYQKIYKKLLKEYFKKIKPKIEEYIHENVKENIKNSKEKIGKEEDFDNEWNKILANENVTTEEELYEKRIFEQQSKTFDDIFYEENYEILLKGGNLITYFEDKKEKKSNIKVDGYIETKKPIHIAHFSIKTSSDDLFKNKINKDDSIKIFSIINKMIEMNKENKINLEEIKNELNLDNSNDKIEQIDEIIDKESILNGNDYEFGIYNVLKEKKEIYDEIEDNNVEDSILYNLIPHEIIFMLNDKKYKLDDKENIILCKKNEKKCKNGFADYDFIPKKNFNNNKEDEKDNFFLRNVIFNNFFKYGISKIINKKINFEIKTNTNKKYEIIINNSKNYNKDNQDEEKIIDNVFLFRDSKNLHFIYFFKKEKSIDGYINFIDNNEEKKKRKIFIKNKIKNIDINKNKYNIFKYLIEVTNFKENNSEIKKINDWFEKKIESNNYSDNEIINEKLNKYYEKIKFIEENKDKFIFNLFNK